MKISEPELIWEYIKSLLNTPYSWGGDNPERGFDCSGFVIEILKAAGLRKNRYDNTAEGLRQELKSEGKLTTTEPQFGDLVFYGRGSRSTHVAFCLNNKLMVEAGGGGSKTITRDDAARHGGWIRIRPIHYRGDAQEIIRMGL